MATEAFPKRKVPPKAKAQQPEKKKKKNAPDRPQPAWLFPPDEENPVLNPKAKTEKDVMKEKEERVKSLDYMKRRVHAAPDRPAPPPQLLTLIGIFLTDFGFNSTSRLFNNERRARQQLNGWEDAIGKRIEKGTPLLEKIYRDWHRDWKILHKDDTSSSESTSGSDSDSADEKVANIKTEGRQSSDDDSEASSDGFGGSDVDMKESSKSKENKTSKRASTSSSSGSSTSDSDADDEEEKVTKPKINVAPKKTSAVPAKPTVGAMINKLKRKAPVSSSESSTSDSESSEEKVKAAPAKKTKTVLSTSAVAISVLKADLVKTKDAESSSSSESSSSETDDEIVAPKIKSSISAATMQPSKDHDSTEDSNSNSSSAENATIANKAKTSTPVELPSIQTAPSDSSVTINGDSKKPSASESSSDTSSTDPSSDSDKPAPVKKSVEPAKKKQKQHHGAKPTPLAEMSAKATDDSHVSNKYQSYAYADKAFKDLSVTRGKGFTKEKNKKKRGSYRGGAIDMSGGKGFKFED